MRTRSRILSMLTLVLAAITVTVSQCYSEAPVPPAREAPDKVGNIPEQAIRDPEVVQQQFQTVVSRLDTGGDLLVVANIDGLLEQFISTTVESLTLAQADNEKTQKIRATVEKLSSFLRRNGFYAIRGLGMSVIPRADGLNTVKTFVSRDSSAAALPLWRALVGVDQRKLAGLDFLPVDTVMARVTNGDFKQLWKLVKSGVKEVAPQETAEAFEKAVSNMSATLSVEVDTLIDSLADEGFISIQFSRDATISIPTASGPLPVPQPSVLLGMAVENDTLLKVIETQLTKGGTPLVETTVGGSVLKSITTPLPLPIPIEPTFTIHSGFFLFGSNTKVVADAVTAFQTKKGLISSPEFSKAFEGFPMVNNGIIYMSPRFAKVVADIQAMAFSAAPSGEAVGKAVAKNLLDLTSKRGEQSCAMVILNWKSGILTKGTSSSGGREIIASMAIAPVGLMAAIAIPSFMKARNTSQQNACINNLRMIDAAKEQWALENNRADGDEVDIEGIKKYLRGSKLPTCHLGGTYSINAIGADPECSIPGHKLP